MLTIHGVLHNVTSLFPGLATCLVFFEASEAFTNHARRERRDEAVSTKGIEDTEQQEFCEPFEILPHPNDIQRETTRAVMPSLDYYESRM
jgi:hypothetical protein